jgi:hypothetical protein
LNGVFLKCLGKSKGHDYKTYSEVDKYLGNVISKRDGDGF